MRVGSWVHRNAIKANTVSIINKIGIELKIPITTGGMRSPKAPPIGLATLPSVVANALCLSGNQCAATLA